MNKEKPVDSGKKSIDCSVIIPVFNEAENLQTLHRKIAEAFSETGRSYEIIFVDDGSLDDSYAVLEELAARDPRVKTVKFRRNFGQTAAIAAGIDFSEGGILIPMDADLQNDPADIPNFLSKIDEGYDLVSGWRKNRKDRLFSRRIPSRIANLIISLVTGVRLKDYGCSLKAYRREIIETVRLYGEMHRFIPAYASWMGAKITEIPVRHHARTRGKSNYGLSRTFKVILDLTTLWFLGGYSTKPIYVFGGLGLVLCSLGIFSGAYTVFEKYAFGIWAHKNPLLLLAIFLFIVGVLFTGMGLLAEIIIRTYHESQGKQIYAVHKTSNMDRLKSKQG